MQATVPILRPKLPSADRLLKYLRQIDSSRYYSNFGPLTASLEERLAHHYGQSRDTTTTVANATLGLSLALAAQGAKPGTLCAMPAWTFVACVHAVVNAGLTPYLIDVDPDTWALDASAIAEEIGRAPGPVGAVMVVSPFGSPIDVTRWDRFRAKTGLPVVIDAAAGFDSLRPCETPTVVSLHATKVLGVGEGGFVISTNPEIIGSVRVRSNFGFKTGREAVVAATNAKLSEYHAAVGLAALDEWVAVRQEWVTVAETYRNALPDSNRLKFQDGFGRSWIASTCVLSLDGVDATHSERALAEHGIETRRWWGMGAHAHTATAMYPRSSLPVTEMLAQSTIAVPFFRDIDSASIGKVINAVRTVTSA